jgi:putative transcriptional regulator
MKTEVLKPAKGRLLVSQPFLNDFYFGRSVILLTEHNKEGSVGFILNKPLDNKIHQIVQEMPVFDVEAYIGGPVDNTSLFYIHTLGDIIDHSEKIMEGLYWGGNFETIKALIENNSISENDIRFFIGYSGWGPSQLDRELREKSWIVSEGSLDKALYTKHELLWSKIISRSGKDNALWAQYPVNPSLN